MIDHNIISETSRKKRDDIIISETSRNKRDLKLAP